MKENRTSSTSSNMLTFSRRKSNGLHPRSEPNMRRKMLQQCPATTITCMITSLLSSAKVHEHQSFLSTHRPTCTRKKRFNLNEQLKFSTNLTL